MANKLNESDWWKLYHNNQVKYQIIHRLFMLCREDSYGPFGAVNESGTVCAKYWNLLVWWHHQMLNFVRSISLALREQILRVFKSQTISTGENFEGLNWKFWRIKKFQFYLNNFDMRDVTLWTMLTSIWDTALALFIILSSTFFTLIFGYGLRHDNILHQHVFYMHIKIPYQISEKKYWL